MLSKLKCEFKTRNQFKPESSNHVKSEDLVKILNGEVRNPNKVKNTNNNTDYTYFIISNVGLEKLEQTKERKFEIDMVDELFYKSEWFCKFTVESESSIVIPNKVDIKFKPSEILVVHYRKGNVWQGIGGFYQLDKHLNNRILTSNIPLEEMIGLVKKTYESKSYHLDLLDKLI